MDWQLPQQFHGTSVWFREHGAALNSAIGQGSNALSVMDQHGATFRAAIEQSAHFLQSYETSRQFLERNSALIEHAVQQQENILRQLYMARSRRERWNERVDVFLQHSSECPATACKGALVRTQTEEDERISEMVGPRYDLECGECRMVVYLPPMLFIKAHGDDYFRAAKTLRSSTKSTSASRVSVFLAHQAAESYLKSLGTCSLYPKTVEGDNADDDEEEYPAGPAFDRRNHDLQGLLDSLYPFVKQRLTDFNGDDAGAAVGELIAAVPKKTSEYFRYGFLLNEAYGDVVIRVDGDVDVDGRNTLLSHIFSTTAASEGLGNPVSRGS